MVRETVLFFLANFGLIGPLMRKISNVKRRLGPKPGGGRRTAAFRPSDSNPVRLEDPLPAPHIAPVKAAPSTRRFRAPAPRVTETNQPGRPIAATLPRGKRRAPTVPLGLVKTVAVWCRLRPLACVLLAGWGDSAMAATLTQETAVGAVPRHVAYLEYQEVAWPMTVSPVNLLPPSTSFKREPDFGTHDVLRQWLVLDGKSRQRLALAWDCTVGRLHVDLNGNLDLTDDPRGDITDAGPRSYATFTNLHLTLQTPEGGRPFVVDLTLFNYGRGNGGGYAALRSFWQGKLTLKGRDFQVGVIDHYFRNAPLTHLLLRPWEQRTASFQPLGGDLAAFEFPRRLFHQGQAYEVTCRFEGELVRPRYRLELQELNPPLGELRVSGEALDRVVLQQADFTVLLDQPKPVERVPVGAYRRYGVALQKGNAVAYKEGFWVTAAQPDVHPANVVTLSLGGPLTNAVSISRRSRALAFDYHLAGADGSHYQFGRPSARRPPEFTVYQGDHQVASGQFQFG